MNYLKKLFLLCCALFAFTAAAVTAQEAKNALLIANGDYTKGISPLTNPVPDGIKLKSALESIGFDVTLVKNANIEDMQKALAAFKAKTQNEGGIAFFHYGGHAVQVNGINYLIPLKARLEDSDDVTYKTLNVDLLMDSIKGYANIVIFDFSRNNLFAQSIRHGTGTHGLATAGINPPNSIIIYSAAAGEEAADGLFTSILTKLITQKNKKIETVLKEVRNEVFKQTGGNQSPVEYSLLISPVYLAGQKKSGSYQTE